MSPEQIQDWKVSTMVWFLEVTKHTANDIDEEQLTDEARVTLGTLKTAIDNNITAFKTEEAEYARPEAATGISGKRKAFFNFPGVEKSQHLERDEGQKPQQKQGKKKQKKKYKCPECLE